MATQPTHAGPQIEPRDRLSYVRGSTDIPLSDATVSRFLRDTAARFPDRPAVIHGVQHILHPPVRLERWPDDDRRTRIVLITRDLRAGEVTPLFDAVLNRSAPDQPDREALLDNPLVPFGGRDR